MRDSGRSERIRTSDPLVPNEVRYRTALRSDIGLVGPARNYNDRGCAVNALSINISRIKKPALPGAPEKTILEYK